MSYAHGVRNSSAGSRRVAEAPAQTLIGNAELRVPRSLPESGTAVSPVVKLHITCEYADPKT